jgi:outer membrane lipoprotein-sorting protein
MKRITTILLGLLLCSPTLRADERSKAILDRLAETINGYGAYQIDFSASMESEFTNIPGKFIVNGKRFYMEVYDSEIFCDGKSTYTYQKISNETTIEAVNPDDRTVLANPTQLFLFYDRDFAHRFVGAATVAGRSVMEVELTPKAKGGGFHSITLGVDPQTGAPVSLSYRMTESGKKTLEVVVRRVTPNVAVTDAMFTFDPKKYPGAEVIDFR